MADQDNKLYEELSENLKDEILHEAADTLFGKRRAIEQEIGLFYDKVDELRQVLDTAKTRQQELHYLLLHDDGAAVSGFYEALRVDPDSIPAASNGGEPSKPPGESFGLTAKGRFAGLMHRAYAAFAEAVNEYMYGKVYSDPKNPKIKRITVNLKGLQEWFEELNGKIRALNRDYAPSQSLDFAKRLNVEQTEKADKMACTLSHCNLDKDMAFPEVQWACLDCVEYPELPPPNEVKATVRGYAKDLYKTHPRETKDIMNSLG